MQACIEQGHVQALPSLSCQPLTQQQQAQAQEQQQAQTQDSSVGRAGLRARGHTVLAPAAVLEPVLAAQADEGPGASQEGACFGQGLEQGAGQGAVGAGAFVPPLLVSGPRGVAVAFTGAGKAVVLDMQEDEEEEDVAEGAGEEEEGEEEEDAGQEGGGPESVDMQED